MKTKVFRGSKTSIHQSLIAAAPELLEVLKKISEFAKIGQPLHWGALITDSDDETAAETVLRVIAKAEGKV